MLGIVASGGGAAGAFEVGAAAYLAESGRCKKGIGVAAGTSVGASFAIAVAHYEPSASQLHHAVKFMKAVWDQIRKSRDVWRKRFPPYVSALYNPSVGTIDPLIEILRRAIDPKKVLASGVKLRMPAVDLLTGETTVFTESSIHLVPGLRASMSFPCAFPPEEIEGGWYTDGGVREVAPVGIAVKEGCDEIIAILCKDPERMPIMKREDLSTTLPVAMRVIDIMGHEILANDVKITGMINKLVENGCAPTNKRYVKLTLISPSTPLGDPLDFSGDKIKREMEQGFEDARKQLERQ
jgi:NTE family protein